MPFIIVIFALIFTDFYALHPISSWLITVVILAATIAGHAAAFEHRGGWAFASSAVTLAGIIAFIFNGLFPRVMISSTDPSYSLTIYNASSSPYTLQVMSIVALIFVPIVLAYQGYTYWVFRKRVSTDTKTLTY